MTPTVDDCSGAFVMNLNPVIATVSDPILFVGSCVSAQFWYRDPGHPDGSDAALTKAVDFIVQP